MGFLSSAFRVPQSAPRHGEGFRFVQDVTLLTVANGLAGVAYWLVHPILGRFMPDLDYAVLVSLLGLLNVLNLPSTTLQIVTARYAAEFAGASNTALWFALARRVMKRVSWYGIPALAAWCAASVPLKSVFGAPSAASLMILGLIAFVSLYSPVVSGVLQGAKLFGWMGAAGAGGAFARLLLCAAVAWAGGGIVAVLAAFAAASLIGVLAGAWPLRHGLRPQTDAPEFDTKPMYDYLWPVLLGQAALFILMNADLIISARCLQPADLAVYGKAAMLSRCVFYLAAPAALAMFPRAVTSGSRALLVGPVVFTLAIALAVAGFVSVFPGFAMRVMYGVQDPSYAALTRKYVWAAFPMSGILIATQYLWARHRTRPVLWLIPAVMLYVALLGLRHSTPAGLAFSLAVGTWTALIAMAGATWRVWTSPAPAAAGSTSSPHG